MNYNVFKISVAFLLISLFGVMPMMAQKKRAHKAYAEMSYTPAIGNYAGLVSKGSNDIEVYKKLGNANYFNAQYKEAAKWYKKVIDSRQGYISPEYYYRYAQSLKSTESYEESDELMELYVDKSFEEDVRRQKFLKNQKLY